MLKSLTNYLNNFGEALDRFLNAALFGGDYVETVSLHAAKSRVEKRRWACWLCAYLSLTVQRNHCDLTLEDGSMPSLSRVLALLQLMALFTVVFFCYEFGWYVLLKLTQIF
jgi:hypothetical protein